MRPLIIAASILLSACRIEQGFDACPIIQIDADFQASIDHAADLLSQRGHPQLPAERLNSICTFRYASLSEIERRSESDIEGLVGLNEAKYHRKGIRFDLMIKIGMPPLQTQHAILHEILHLYFKNHDEVGGIMQRSVRNESELSPEIIESMLHQAIFDEAYQAKMIMR